MKIFVAGKIGEEDEAKKAMELFRDAGHEITFDWTSIPHLKPYDQNQELSRKTAILEYQGIEQAEALVLLLHKNGRGMYVELGMALSRGKPVFAVGGEGYPTMFLFHPLVQRVNTVYDALRMLSPQKIKSSTS